MIKDRMRAGGVREKLHKVLAAHPNGLTTVQLLAAGKLSVPVKNASAVLSQMRTSGQVAGQRCGRECLWTLLPPAIKPTPAKATAPANAAPDGWASQLATPADDFASTTAQKKARESAAIAEQLADFQRHGGRIEVLGNTPLRKEPSYRASMRGVARQSDVPL
jgi:hypothetical protein